jgi:hypothetical protein
MAAMELGNTPKPAAWIPPLASFSPPALILATSSSNSFPHLAAAVFWWLASVGWFVRWVPTLGHLGGCIYVLGVPLGVLHLALHEILLGREANLVSIKSVSSRFSWFAVLPCRCHNSHVRTPNNANSVSRLCDTKLSSTFVFISFFGNEDKISKSALEDNLFWFRTDYAAGISGDISPSSLILIEPSTCPNRRYRRGPQLW